MVDPVSEAFLAWYEPMLEHLEIPNTTALHKQGLKRASHFANPNTRRFWQILDNLPKATPTTLSFDTPVIQIGNTTDLPPNTDMLSILKGLIPWRKGPFSVFGTTIDTEWRSDMKWDRLAPTLPPLSGKTVLDVGCGSGYYMYRSLTHTPTRIIGIDPSDLFLSQYMALSRYITPYVNTKMGFFPFPYSDVLGFLQADLVLAMGILYHQRSPIQFLQDLKKFTKSKGEVILETLVLDSPDDIALFPKDRYAKMRNVYFIPSLSCLDNLCQRAGWHHRDVIDVTPTTPTEQRRTTWVNTESLENFLDKKDPKKTIEGYPAPIRAMIKLA